MDIELYEPLAKAQRVPVARADDASPNTTHQSLPFHASRVFVMESSQYSWQITPAASPRSDVQ